MAPTGPAQPAPHPESFLGFLDESVRRSLLALGSERGFESGGYLLLEGDLSNHVYLLLVGQVKVYRAAPDGTRLLLALRGPGDVLGELAALGGEEQVRAATVEAMEPCRAQVMTAARFLDFLLHHPPACLALARNVRARLQDAERMRLESVMLDATARVTRRLAELAERYGTSNPRSGRLELHVTQEELAGWAGASRESVARAVRSLRNRRLVVTRYRTIEILDPVALSAAARSA